jgi:glycosyltransferase involved in cell wall biosynthesis
LARADLGIAGAWPDAPLPVVRSDALPRQPTLPRIKVLHVITRFMDGSGGNTLLTIEGMDPRRYEIWVAASPQGGLWARAESHGVTTVKLSRLRETLSPLDDLLTLVRLVRLMRRERFTIVHTHSSKAGFLGRLAAWLCRTPVIVHTIHGFSWHDFMSRPRRRAYVAAERLVGKMTDAFFAVAPRVALEAVETRMARPGSVAVVPSGIELSEIQDDLDLAARSELSIPPESVVVGTVGRVDFQKAPLDFVRMAASVSAARPGTRFVWIGDGELRSAAEAEAARLGVDVLFVGFRTDAARLAAAFDVYVVSSLYEGLGRSLSEALASGRPVAATAVNGVVDLISPGATGLLSPPADPEALARNVCWLLEHPEQAQRMGAAGRVRARTLFDPALMCALIEQAYARLLGLPGPLANEPAARRGESRQRRARRRPRTAPERDE